MSNLIRGQPILSYMIAAGFIYDSVTGEDFGRYIKLDELDSGVTEAHSGRCLKCCAFSCSERYTSDFFVGPNIVMFNV